MRPDVFDLLLAAIVAFGVWSGWRHGFILAALDLLALAAGVVVALAGYRQAAALVDRHVAPLGVWSAPLAFLALYVLTRIVIALLSGRLLRRVPRHAHAHGGNRFLGMLPGAVNGLINAAIVALLLLALPLPDDVAGRVRESALARALTQPAEWAEAKLAPIFEPAVRRTLELITVQPQSRERIELGFTVSDPSVRADLEARMLALVNQARAEHGLRPLAPDPDATEVARAHSRDMFARGYFSHVSPEGHDPFDRLRESRVRFLAAGENLALAPTLARAHEGLMDSPGHRANILRPAFGRLGVGVLDGGRRGLMVTQVFRN